MGLDLVLDINFSIDLVLLIGRDTTHKPSLSRCNYIYTVYNNFCKANTFKWKCNEDQTILIILIKRIFLNQHNKKKLFLNTSLKCSRTTYLFLPPTILSLAMLNTLVDTI